MRYYSTDRRIVGVEFEQKVTLGNPSIRTKEGWVYPEIKVDDIDEVSSYRLYSGEVEDGAIYVPDLMPETEKIPYSGSLWDLARHLNFNGHDELCAYKFSRAQYVCPVCGHTLHHLSADILDCRRCGARVNREGREGEYENIFMMISRASCQSSARQMGISVKEFEALVQPYLYI